MDEFRKYAAMMAMFAGGLYVALLVASFGVIALGFNIDVIADRSAGPLVGPVMAIVAVAVVFFSLLELGLRVPEAKQRIAFGRALLIGIGAYALYAISGGILVAIGDKDPLRFVFFTGEELLSPFSIVVGAWALIIALLYMLILAGRVRSHGTPKWPWEKDDDEP